VDEGRKRGPAHRRRNLGSEKVVNVRRREARPGDCRRHLGCSAVGGGTSESD
jgi:hypothetical protein